VLERVQRDAVAGTVRSGAEDPVYDELVKSLTDAGALSKATSVASVVRVHLAGQAPVACLLAEMLTGPACEVTSGPIDQDVVAVSDLVVSCASWLPDRAWSELAEMCRRHGTAWHGSYAEGSSVVVGPMWLPGQTASYLDVRGRRLAAAAAPDELRALWRHLEGAEHVPEARWDQPSAAVAAALIAADVQAWRADRPLPQRDTQVVFDLASGRFDRHPVIPLPVTA
jgi:hypothetical protein